MRNLCRMKIIVPHFSLLRGILKIRFFEADKILKLEFPIVNEDVEEEAQPRKKPQMDSGLRTPVKLILGVNKENFLNFNNYHKQSQTDLSLRFLEKSLLLSTVINRIS